ncbi:MAG: hypothetical protein AAFV07_08070, partial [Bacteroidota bacterium]
MLSAADLSKIINKNSGNLLDTIDIESIRTYWRLRRMLMSEDISENDTFRDMYRSYYSISGVGVGKAFLDDYFAMLNRLKEEETMHFRQMSIDLYGPRPKRKLSSAQFGFLTKMANLINPRYPVYDNYVAELYEFDKPTQPRLESRERLNAYQAFHNHMVDTYQTMLDNGSLHDTLVVFKILLRRYKDEEFESTKLDDFKKIDYLLETIAKLSDKK